RRWLPWTRHLHLHTTVWDEQGQIVARHLPTNGTHTYEQWPLVSPSADMAQMVVAAQPACTIVLEHNPRAVSPEELEAAHAWAAALVSGT
ncbi:MAG TPA: hypothetical protein VK464_02055, partial [Symbiobacteriaceae bacterium]|nr:hypothetical protein [Symbiobacteriaceae bacterium]